VKRNQLFSRLRRS